MTQPSRIRRVTRRTAQVLGNTLVVAVLLAGAAYVAVGHMGFERYVITGGSMSGSIEKGSVLFSRAVPVQELAVGDVITYLPPADTGVTNLVTHRITTIDATDEGAALFTTQGDANAKPDPWEFTLDRQTQPVAAFSIPWIGYLFLVLGDRGLRVLVIGVPAAIITVVSLVQVIRALFPGRDDEADTTPTTDDALAPAGA
ncbi:signal peptidase I [Cellulomonas bogoriensis]|uniref:Signal peptidase I n=1 Tax=Cellulomonas bogoriensis 69B4 = DSM 16987 TaxID=1386082 RepID=A0A0A0C250_9CELL|nr:signal peptidase I [Cellulomonas bogoriensis]KGM14220.1 peptidase S26B, signal peptidase [Cellulomonas bogoriensis 69B4 = DSM 16987]